jgi:ABC-type proline/glycine betaine transport system permease subunit
VTENQAGGSTGRMVRDIVVYTLARLGLVAILTAGIYFVAQLIGVQVPLAVAVLFAIVIALPLGIWVLAPLRRRATEVIAEVDERRRRDREQLEARLRGEKPE